MGRLEDLRINAYLSKVARGYSNNAFIADVLFPEIDSESEKTDILEFNKEAFSIYNTDRAIRANSNVISPKGFNKKTVTLQEHDLAYPIDYREEDESQKVKLQVHATNVVTEGLKLKYEKTCADLVQSPETYVTGNKATLATKLSDTENSKPYDAIETAKDTVASKIAQDPNTMVIGLDAWKYLKRNKQLKDMLSISQEQILTLEFLKKIFEIENIVVGKSVFADEQGNFTRVWGDNIILTYTSKIDSRTQYDPAFAYTVKKKNALVIDEYQKEGKKVKYIRATDIYSPFVVGPEAGYLLHNLVN
jgi:hypothetical protein